MKDKNKKKESDMISIKHRILALAVVTGIGGFVIASDENKFTPEQYCQQSFGNTSIVMELRQAEPDSRKEEVRQIASSTLRGEAQILRAIVDEAFKTPYQHSFQQKQEVTKEFASKGYDICLSIKK